MEDRRTREDIKRQVENIKVNNLNNLEAMAGIEMLMTSNNNGTVKDSRVSMKYKELKEKVDEINSITEEFISMLK